MHEATVPHHNRAAAMFPRHLLSPSAAYHIHTPFRDFSACKPVVRRSLARPCAQVIVSCNERIDRPLGAKRMFDSTSEIGPDQGLRAFEVAPASLRDGSSENESCPG